MCHHPEDRFTLKSMAIATKHHRNRDEKSCQSKKLTNNYDTDAICATKKHGKLWEIFAIATKILGRVKAHRQFTLQMPYVQ
jgi:hypothetical protein